MTLQFLIYDVSIAIETNSPVALASFKSLYHSFESAEDSLPDVHIKLVLDGSQWAAFEGEVKRLETATLPAMLLQIESWICTRVVERRSDLLTIHGATLWTPQGGLLILGASGAGKSTLSLALTTQGCKVCSDDYAFLEHETGRLLPMPRFFHLDATSCRLLAATGVERLKGDGEEQILTPHDLGWRRMVPIEVNRIVHLRGNAPEDHRSDGPLLQAVSQAEMLAVLTGESGRDGLCWEDDLPKLAALAARSKCYRMYRGTLGLMKDEITGLLRAPSSDTFLYPYK